MTTLYYQNTVTSIFVGQTGHVHNRMAGEGEDELPIAVDCTSCEPYLVKEGWVYSPELVPLTNRQEAEQERVEREGNMAVKQVAEALASNAAVMLATGAAKTRTSTRRRTKKTTAN